jgi:DNA-binding transcriptional regulator YdaS (Cro superfamily)
VDKGLEKAIAAAGGSRKALAKRLGIHRQAVDQWARIPIKRVLQVEKAVGVAREELRSDLFRRS